MTNRLAGKRCLITGASRGIGKEIASAYIDSGAAVALLARSSEQLSKVANSMGERALPVTCDVRKLSEIEDAVDTAVSAFGGLDVVVNNAGIIEKGPLIEQTEEAIERVVDVNLNGQIRIAQTALPHLSESGGTLINVSSQLGSVGVPNASVYCATKGGINNLTRQLSLEYADDGVRVNALAPGVVQTDMTADGDEEWASKKREQIPLNRLGTTDDMRGPAVFLASDESAYMTGHVLVVDGGYLAK